jgi:glucose/arabinose dehydrogenase
MLRYPLVPFVVLASIISPTLAQENVPGEFLPRREAAPGVPPFAVRPGYQVTLAAEGLPEARFITFDDNGTLYLSQPEAGAIVTLRDADGDGKFEVVNRFVTDRKKVHAMQFKDGWLWFAQTGSVHRARDADGDGKADEVVTLVPDGALPGGTGHWWRSLLVTDDAFYTSIGDSGNITDEAQTERQKIWKFSLDGKNKTLFASGLRNTEELQVRPGTKDIWGVDHNSDAFGKNYGEVEGKNQPITDRLPPDEFNRYVEGAFYGHPFIVGPGIPRPEYVERKDLLELAAKTVVPEWNLGAHWAANGWTFLTKDDTAGNRGDAFVACRGSWNSTKKVGYRVERVLFDRWTGKPYGSQMIVGTLGQDGNTVLARPVDCAEAPDGSVLFTCDVTKRIYRISREQRAAQAK